MQLNEKIIGKTALTRKLLRKKTNEAAAWLHINTIITQLLHVHENTYQTKLPPNTPCIVNPITFFSLPRSNIFSLSTRGSISAANIYQNLELLSGSLITVSPSQHNSPHHRHLQSELQVVHKNKPTSKDSVHEYVINTHMAFLFFLLILSHGGVIMCVLVFFSSKNVFYGTLAPNTFGFLNRKDGTGVFASRHNNRPTLHAELSSHNFKPLIFTASFWCLSIEITPSFIIRKLKALSRSIGRVDFQACSSFFSFRVSLHKISENTVERRRMGHCYCVAFTCNSRLYVSVETSPVCFCHSMSSPDPYRP